MRKNLLIVAAFTALTLAACGQQGPIDEKALDVFTEDIAKKELQIIEKNKIIEV